jgi:ParB family chromosome partitioning protein
VSNQLQDKTAAAPITTELSQQCDSAGGGTPGNIGQPRVVSTIAIEDIVIQPGRRAVRQEKVDELVESMSQIGLQSPITVRPIEVQRDGVSTSALALVAGLHRVNAAKALGWPDIHAFLLEGDEIEARLWEIAENLHTTGLMALDEAEQRAEWVQLTESRKSVSRQNVAKGGRPEGAISKAARDLPIRAKTQRARRKAIERSMKIASISRDAKDAARNAGLADRLSALLEIAKEKGTEAQLAKVRELSDRKPGRKRTATPDRANREGPETVMLEDKKLSGTVNIRLDPAKEAVLEDLVGTFRREVMPKLTNTPTVVREKFLDEVGRLVRGL